VEALTQQVEALTQQVEALTAQKAELGAFAQAQTEAFMHQVMNMGF
jgi:hypothetical protein